MLDPVSQVQAHVDNVLGAPDAKLAIGERVQALFQTHPPEEVARLTGEISDHAENYFRGTVWILGQCDQAAAAAGLTHSVGPVLLQSANYFLNPADYLPDQYGLLGLLDDAYLCCRFMAELNALYRAENGVDLLDLSLDQACSPTVRNLIGPPIDAQLDMAVQQGIQQVLQLVQLSQMQPIRYQSPAHWNEWVDGENAVNVEAEISSITTGW
jgi:hypothetical protein